MGPGSSQKRPKVMAAKAERPCEPPKTAQSDGRRGRWVLGAVKNGQKCKFPRAERKALRFRRLARNDRPGSRHRQEVLLECYLCRIAGRKTRFFVQIEPELALREGLATCLCRIMAPEGVETVQMPSVHVAMQRDSFGLRTIEKITCFIRDHFPGQGREATGNVEAGYFLHLNSAKSKTFLPDVA